jgi:hypothetical protein
MEGDAIKTDITPPKSVKMWGFGQPILVTFQKNGRTTQNNAH